MTNEQKAKAYDEALDRCKEWASGTCGHSVADSPKDIAEFIFPQLAESKDEKIREFLIGILSQGTWRKEWPFSPNEVVAYLERQNHVQSDTEKEYVRTLKSLIFNFLSGKDEVDRDYYQRIEDWLDGRHVEKKEQESTNVLEDAFKYYTDRGITISCGDFKAEPKKEQKPEYTVFVGGSEVNDELLIKDEAEILAKKYKEDGYDDVVIERIEHQPAECLKAERDGWYVCIKDYYRGGKKCSSAGDLVLAKGGMHIMGEKDISEWFRRAYYEEVREVFRPNEEDVYITNILERIVGKNRPDEIFKIGNKQGVSAYKICSWLKSLPERLNLQPVEWSEEDADMLNCCISSIEEAKENRYAYKETDGDTSYDREIDWLKSLCPQPHTVSIKNATKFGNLEYERGVKDGIQSEKSRQWKPSEEQIATLEQCLKDKQFDGDSRYVYPIFESLYNDLEKLIAKKDRI